MDENLPWTFGEAERRLTAASVRQQATQDALKDAYRAFGRAQESYARALADTITELRADGIAVTVCLELAKGTERVAGLRLKRDVAEGVKAAAEHASWRRNADRRDVARLSDWSQRREMAEVGGDVRNTYEKPIGGVAA